MPSDKWSHLFDVFLPTLFVPLTEKPSISHLKDSSVSPKSATPTLDTSSHFTAATEIVLKHKPGQVTPLPWTSPLPSGESPSSLGLQDRPMGFLEVDGLLMEIQPNEWPLFSTEVGWGRGRQVRVKAGLEHWPVPASGNRLATRQSSSFINHMFSGWGAPRKGLRVQWGWEREDWGEKSWA